jgi:CRP/FNR family nitrogen fixation transcriptional regulator
MPRVNALARHRPMSAPKDLLESIETVTTCHRGRTIYGHEDPADSWYRVVSGAARESTVLADGRRRIVDFLLPGDFFGFGARLMHAFSVEAIVEGTIIARYPRRHVELLADSDPQLGRRIRNIAFDAISRSLARMLILGRATAVEKVGAFLIDMAERSSDDSSGAVVLPMSRYDIADYLAMSVETVSRMLTDLNHRGSIKLLGIHRIRIVDRDALEVADEQFGVLRGHTKHLVAYAIEPAAGKIPRKLTAVKASPSQCI